MAQLVAPELTEPILLILGVSLTAGALTVVLAVVYRWYSRDRLPTGLALLSGFGVVAAYLNTTAALGQAIVRGSAGLFDIAAVIPNVATFLLAGVTALAGARLGDRLAEVVSAATGTRTFETDVSRIVTAAGRAIAVDIPDEIDDLEGYDAVPAATKETLAGQTLLFPRRLTVAELRDRLVTRLKEDYGVGHVSLELEDDGTVSRLAVGRRAAGLGPSLPPGTVATALHADPPFSGSAGDAIQVWSPRPDPTRIATGELRAKREDVVTIALDERDAALFDLDERYRLVTLPAADLASTEFAGLLRVADVSFGEVTVEPGSALEAVPVGAIDATVVGVGLTAAGVDVLPAAERVLRAGDTIYVLARSTTRRRLETAARATSAGPAAGTRAADAE